MSDFISVVKDHVARTKASEPGCLQFDILLPHDEEHCVRLHEVYADKSAFDIHNASEQLSKYKAESNPLLAERSITWCTVEE